MKKNEESLHKVWYTIKRNSLCVTGGPEEREKGAENFLKEIMAENFPNLWRYLDIQVHEAHRSPQNFTLKISSPRHIIIKLSKSKHKEFLKPQEKNILQMQGNSHKFTSGFLSRNLAGHEKVE